MIDVRQTRRRLEFAHVVLAAMWGSGTVVAAVVHWSQGPGTVIANLGLGVAGLVLVYLAAPAASITVTSRCVIVRNPFRRYVVPRRLVQGVDAQTLRTPRLLVRNAPSVRLAALNLNLPRGYQRIAGRHERQGMTSLLSQIPEEPNDGTVVRRIRYGNVLLLVVTVVATVAAFRYLLSTQPV